MKRGQSNCFVCPHAPRFADWTEFHPLDDNLERHVAAVSFPGRGGAVFGLRKVWKGWRWSDCEVGEWRNCGLIEREKGERRRCFEWKDWVALGKGKLGGGIEAGRAC